MPRLDDNLYLHLLRSFSVLLLVYVVAAVTVYGESAGFTRWGPRVIGSLALMALFVVCYSCEQVVLYRDDKLWMNRLLWVEAALLVPLLFVTSEMDYLLSFVAFWVARLPYHFDLRTCTRYSVVALLCFLAIYYLRGDEEMPVLLIFGILAPATFFFVLTTSYSVINFQRQRQKALELNRDLLAAQLLLAQSSRTAERLRIARDIHDLLGHHMTALILNLEVATHKTPGDGKIYVERSLALGKMLLGDLRNAVSDLRENPALDFDSSLQQLLADVPQLRITLEREAEFALHDPHTAEVLLRCIQEALTNTLKHAQATHCHIRLSSGDGEVVLDIRDDGTSAAGVTPGNGLKGMQERISALAGTLQWRSDNGSFYLNARLPLARISR